MLCLYFFKYAVIIKVTYDTTFHVNYIFIYMIEVTDTVLVFFADWMLFIVVLLFHNKNVWFGIPLVLLFASDGGFKTKLSLRARNVHCLTAVLEVDSYVLSREWMKQLSLTSYLGNI